jgi:hypothetical protein
MALKPNEVIPTDGSFLKPNKKNNLTIKLPVSREAGTLLRL